jgi:hypothetical protein
MADRKAIVLGSAGNQELFQSTDKLVLDGATLFKSDVHIDGSLVVNGTSTTLDTVTLTVDDVNIELGAVNEVHNIPVTPENLAYTLSDGTNSVTTSALGASPTIATLVTAIAAASGYSSLEFTVSANSNSDGIHLTYKTIGPKAEVATLTKDGGSPITATVITNVSDTTSDGGGLSLYGTTVKTFNWSNSTGSWTSSENIDLASGKDFKINGTSVLTHNALGSGVTSSSLTAVGTITTGTWNGTAIGQAYGGTGYNGTFTDGNILIGKTDGTLAKAFLTQGTNTVITNGDGSIEIAAKDTTYTISAEQTSGTNDDPDIKITAGGNGSTVSSTVSLVGAGATTVTRNSASQITISSVGGQNLSATEAQGDVKLSLSSNGGDVTLTGGTATTVTRTSATEITIDGQDTTYTNATSSAAGLMSATDKTRLDTLHAGSNVNYLLASGNDDFAGRLSHNNPGGVALYVRGENSDTTVYRVTSQTASGATTDTSGMYGFSMVYTGTGAGNNNSLDLYSDNQNAQSQTHVYSVTQDGVLDFKVAPTISGNGLLTSATTFGGDVSGTSNALVVADNSHNHTIANVTSLATTLADKIGISGGTINGLFAVKRYYANRDDTAAEFGYFTSSANTTARTAGFITAKGALYLGNNGDTTTSNFKTKLAEDGSATFAGNLGIGTESPQSKLVVSNAGSNGIEFIPEVTTDQNLILSYDRSGSARSKLEIDSSELLFTNANSERMRIDSSGRLLVGTSSASTNGLLTVQCDTNQDGIVLRAENAGGQGSQPGIVFEGPTGTELVNIYTDNTASELRINTASTERMRIDNSGKVGIGCTPVRDLQLHTADASSELMLSNSTTGATSGSGFMIQQDGNDNYIWNKENSFMSFGTNATERMRIDSSGKLLVGKTASSGLNAGCEFRPEGIGLFTRTSDNPLQVRRLTTDGSMIELYRDGVLLSTIGSDNSALTIGMAGAEKMRIDSSGRVGIGEDAPISRLHLADSGSGSVMMTVTNDTSGHTSGNGVEFGIGADEQAQIWNYENSYFRIGTNNSEAMRIDSSGRVGIGTSSPANDIHILGTTGARIQNSADTDSQFLLTYSSNNPDFRMLDTTGTTTVKLLASGNSWFNGGNVGIGTTSPAAALDVVSTTEPQVVIANSDSNGANLRFQNSATGSGQTNGLFVGIDAAEKAVIYNYENTDLLFGTNSTERARIDSSGRLLVGTSTGSYTSEIASDIEANFAVRTYNNSSSNFAGIRLFKSRGSEASPTVVSDDDRLCDITTYGHDGTTWVAASSIRTHVDGTPSSNDMPGRLVFSTTADGQSTPTERMRIDSSGVIDFTGPGYTPSTNSCFIKQDSSGEGYLYNRGNNDLLFGTNNTERMRIDNSGNVVLKPTNPAGVSGTNTNYLGFRITQTNGQSALLGTINAQGQSSWGGDLVFSTKPGNGAPNDSVTERMRIDSSGNVKFEYTDSSADPGNFPLAQIPPGLRIYNKDNTLGRLAGIHFSHGGAGTANAGIFHVTTSTATGSTTCLGDLAFYMKASGASTMVERMRIDSSGRLLVNASGYNDLHRIPVTPENLAYTLSDGTNSVTTSALGASPTIATLVQAITTASGYSSLEFTVSENVYGVDQFGNSFGQYGTPYAGIELTYKTTGIKSPVATLTKDGGSPITATAVFAGEKLQVLSGDAAFNGVWVGRGGGDSENTSVVVGGDTLYANTTGYRNVAVGQDALEYNTTGYRNTAVGQAAMWLNTTGFRNTAVGSSALINNTTGSRNAAVGQSALSENTTGYYNTAFGYYAHRYNTTGANNTAIGNISLYNNTTGNHNTAVGIFVSFENTTGSYNTAVGSNSLYRNTTGTYNTCMGYRTAYFLTTGRYNTNIGSYAGWKATTADYNVGVGVYALRSNTTGDDNVAIGMNSLYSGTAIARNTAVGKDALYVCNADDNVAIGYYSAKYQTSAVENTCVGVKSLFRNNTGGGNVAVGFEAARGDMSITVVGTYNTAIGHKSLHNFVGGSHNVAIGHQAGVNVTSGSGNFIAGSVNSGGTYQPVLNITTESDRVVIGHTSTTNAYIQVAWTVNSDARDKMNFSPVPHGLDFINQLQPTAYQFKVDRGTEEPKGPVRYGFKAQDILAIEGDDPVIIDTEDADRLKMSSDHLLPILVKAIQELSAENASLNARLDAAGI